MRRPIDAGKEVSCFVLFIPAFFRFEMEEISESQIIETAPSKRTEAWFKSEAAIRMADLLAGAIAIALLERRLQTAKLVSVHRATIPSAPRRRPPVSCGP